MKESKYLPALFAAGDQSLEAGKEWFLSATTQERDQIIDRILPLFESDAIDRIVGKLAVEGIMRIIESLDKDARQTSP